MCKKKRIFQSVLVIMAITAPVVFVQDAPVNASVIKEVRNNGREYLVPCRDKLVVTRSTAIFIDPARKSGRTGVAQRGQQFQAMGKMSGGGWYLVKKGKKMLGYIPASCLALQGSEQVRSESHSVAPVAPVAAVPDPSRSTPSIPVTKPAVQQRQCEELGLDLITLERTEEQLATVEKQWGRQCPGLVAKFRQAVQSVIGDPLYRENIKKSSFKLLLTSLENTPDHDNADLARFSLVQKAESMEDLSRLIEFYPEMKTVAEKRGAEIVTTVDDARLFLRLYPESGRWNAVVGSLLQTAQRTGVETFLSVVQAFPQYEVPEEMQIWYVNSLTDRDQLKEIGHRFPAARKAYVEQSATLGELLEAVALYPEFTQYAAERAPDYIRTREEAREFFKTYPESAAREKVLNRLAEKALQEGRKSFREFVAYFPDYKVSHAVIEKYINLAPDLESLRQDAEQYPELAKKEYFTRAKTSTDLIAALDIFPEEKETVKQSAAGRVRTVAEAKEYLATFKGGFLSKNPYEKTMYSSLLAQSKEAGRESFTEVLEAFPKLKATPEQVAWYVRSAGNTEELDYAVKRLTPENIDVKALRRRFLVEETRGRHAKIWKECAENIIGVAYLDIADCFSRITRDEIPTQYADHAQKIVDEYTALTEIMTRVRAKDKKIKKRLLHLVGTADWVDEATMEHCPCFLGKRLFHSTARLKIRARVKDFSFDEKKFVLQITKTAFGPGVSSDYEAYQEAKRIVSGKDSNQVGATVEKTIGDLYNPFFWDVFKGEQSPRDNGWTDEDFDFLLNLLLLTADDINHMDTALQLIAQRIDGYAGAFLYRNLVEHYKEDLSNYNKWDNRAEKLLKSCPEFAVKKEAETTRS